MSTKRFVQRAAVLAGVAGLTGLMGAGLASAHVTADYYGQEPQKGGRGLIVLRVPNEEADAGTTKVEVAFPAEYGITSARTKPVPGWTAEVSKATLPTPVKNGKGADVAEVISKITWTAQGDAKIAAGSGEYQEFEFNASTLPSTVDTLVMPATQTYENGKVVAWDAPPPPEGGAEPEHPAPTIKLAAASSGGDHGHGAAANSEEQSSGHNEASGAAGTDNTARWLGGVGLAVGALGLGVGAGATIRTRRGSAPKADA
ncbi:YcnI family protein [Amycolatopsis lurida]